MSATHTPKVVDVAVGVIVRGQRVFVAQRPEQAHQGGCWEFPGGKFEAGENAEQALGRELGEELGIELERASMMMKISHDYPEKTVNLHVMWVTAFSGEPTGAEGQPVAWVDADTLAKLRLPAANQAITEQVIRQLSEPPIA